MIRRDVTLSAGRPGWALISQVEHARIAAEVCAAWNAAAFPLAVPHDELLAAVVHHDDGWLVWEMRPTTVDGRPRDFMEMPLDESLAIWRRSIAVAQTFGPLAAYAVGSHFAALCRWSREKAGHTEEWRYLADEFIAEQDELAATRLQELTARAGVLAVGATSSTEDDALLKISIGRNADRAWHALQFFDRVSLWLCCAERREVETIDVPESLGSGLGAFRFTPLAGEAGGAGAEISIEPWPLAVDRLEITTIAVAVPQAHYDSPDALAQAERASIPLRWVLLKR